VIHCIASWRSGDGGAAEQWRLRVPKQPFGGDDERKLRAPEPLAPVVDVDADAGRWCSGCGLGARREEQEELRRRLPAGRGVVVGVQDGGGADRAREDAAAEPGRADPHRQAVGAVQGHRRLLRPHRPGRGRPVAVARQHHQRHPLLPHAGAQLRVQGLLQVPLQLQPGQGRLLAVVRREHRLGERRRGHVAALRLLPRLRQNASHQRLQGGGGHGQGRREAVHGARRRLPEDAPVRWRRRAVPRVQRLGGRDRRLPGALLRHVRLLQAGAAHGEAAGQLLRELGARLDDHQWRQPRLVPARHCPEKDDDDLGGGRQVQELHGRLRADRQERGTQVALQRRRCQRPTRHRRRWRACRLRPAAAHLLRQEVRLRWRLNAKQGGISVKLYY